MSFSNVASRIIDPVFDRSGLRVEFRLPSSADQVYLSDLRLINVGVNSSSATDEPNRLLGILGSIKSVAVLDGSIQLDRVDVAPIYNAFRNANMDNDSNLSMNRFLKYLQTGYMVQGNYEITGAGNTQFALTSPEVKQQNPQTYTGSALSAKRCWLSLKEMLPFLKSSLVLPTSVFKDLRVVVEYNSSAELQFLTKDSSATKTSTADALLLADELEGGDMRDQMLSQYQGVVFRPIENERVVCPAITKSSSGNTLADTAGNVLGRQENSFVVHGAMNKKLIKVVVVQTPTDSTTWLDGTDVDGFGNVGSVAQYKTEFQLIVNGVAKLPSSGMSASSTGSYANRRLAYLNDTWGRFNIITGQNVINLNRLNDFTADDKLKGQQDYIGCMVDETVSELRVNYNRTGIFGNAKTLQALNLNIFYEVEKAVVMNADGSYSVIYTQ